MTVQQTVSYCTLVQLWHSHIVIALEGLYSRLLNHINHLATYNNMLVIVACGTVTLKDNVTCTSCSPVQESIADLKPQCGSHPSDPLHKLLSLFLLQVQHIPVLEQNQGSDQPVMRKSQGYEARKLYYQISFMYTLYKRQIPQDITVEYTYYTGELVELIYIHVHV